MGLVRDVVIEVREPYARAALVHFLALACVPGVETLVDGVYSRTLRLPHGPARVEVHALDGGPGTVCCRYDGHPADLAAATAWLGTLVDAAHDPAGADRALSAHPLLAPLVRATPGLRVHRDADVFEVVVRTVIGQQVSVAGARTLTARMVAAVGTPVDLGEGLTRLFPTPEQVAALAPEDFAMPRARGRALVGLAAAVAGGAVDVTDRDQLLALPGIGPWSVDHVAMRSLGDPDVFLPTDIGVRRAAERLGTDLPSVVAVSGGWRPWRSYALTHLWQVATTVGAAV